MAPQDPPPGSAAATAAGNLRGMGFMLGSASSISAMAGAVQYLAAGLHPFEIAFFRHLFGVVFLSATLLRGGLHHLRTRRFAMHALRALFNVAAMLAYFLGLSLEPLATVVALSLTTPLFATVGTVLFLGERMTRFRWLALLVGAAGALLILRPGIQVVSLGALLILFSNANWAAALVVIKSLARTESSLTITIYAALLQAPVALAFAVFFWRWPDAAQLAWLVAIGLLGTAAQLFLSQAFREADATLVLPIDFTKVIWASLIGYVFFAQVPEIWVGIGAVVIFAGVFANAYSERRAAP